jgi:benzoyl-CoA reductase/2-hydroxyglutaryl-CoA dehydratase subunit BcrC/BadD/HgdB
MSDRPEQITCDQWDRRFAELSSAGTQWPWYCDSFSHHIREGDTRLRSLVYDNAPAAFRLWQFLLSEEQRLHQAKTNGALIVGTMKDLGTIPVMAYALDHTVAFYPDGAWWIPCVMELGAGLLSVADNLGVDESFCPVRAMLGAFVTEAHFPRPDLLICSVGAVCDDFSAIARRLPDMGFPVFWWEIPHRRHTEPDEQQVTLPGGHLAPVCQVEQVKAELHRVRVALEEASTQSLDKSRLSRGIRQANQVRAQLAHLRELVYGATPSPLGALEMLVAEMLAIHFCSDLQESLTVLADLVELARTRINAGVGITGVHSVRIFWVNPVADLQAMNLLEQCGGRLCGTDFLFTHTLDMIPEDIDPLDALARMALADPMVGSAYDRAERIVEDIRHWNAEAMIVSRIPGASHCAIEGRILCEVVQEQLGLPCLEIEVPPLADSMASSLRTRLEALIEVVKERR